MNKLLFFICFFCCGIAFTGNAQVVRTYFDDAAGITAIYKVAGSPNIIFKVDNNGVPVPNDTVAFNNAFNKVLAKINLVKQPRINPVKTDSVTRGSGRPGSPGVAQPTPTGTRNPVQTSTTSYANLTPQTIDSVRTELLYLLFIKNDNIEADFEKVSQTIPTRFTLLGNPNLLGIANSTLGGTNFSISESSIIYGITDFIIARAKEELVQTYLNQWYLKLSADGVISPLIPQTLSVFKAFNEDNSIGLAKYGDKWKAAFQEDLRNLPVQLQNETYVSYVLQKASVKNTYEIAPIITGGDELVYNLYLKNHLVSVLNTMANQYTAQTLATGTDAPAFKRLVVLSNILLNACGNMDSQNSTFQPVNLNSLKLYDPGVWQIVLKLIYLRNNVGLKYVFNKEGIASIFNMLLDNAKLNQFIALFEQTTTTITSYQGIIAGKSSQLTVNLNSDDARKLFDVSFQLVDNIEGYLNLFDPDAKRDSFYINNIKPYYSDLSQIGAGVATQQYATVLDGAIAIINKANVLGTADKNVAANTTPAGQGSSSGGGPVNLSAAIPVTVPATRSTKASKTADTVSTLSQTIKDLQVYGSFMVNILSAKTGEDVKSAMDELIPQGDFNLKNAPNFTVSLSAFPGVFVGAESVSKYRTDNTGSPLLNQPKVSSIAFSPGVYLPIGIDINWGHQAKGSTPEAKKYNSWGLLIQAADLGAVLSYRLNSSDQTVSSDPNISFKQILSPGLAITHHLTNSPLLFGVGVNYSPDLRTINQSGVTYQANSLRYGAFIAIDVTFFNISVKKLKQNGQ